MASLVTAQTFPTATCDALGDCSLTFSYAAGATDANEPLFQVPGGTDELTVEVTDSATSTRTAKFVLPVATTDKVFLGYTSAGAQPQFSITVDGPVSSSAVYGCVSSATDACLVAATATWVPAEILPAAAANDIKITYRSCKKPTFLEKNMSPRLLPSSGLTVVNNIGLLVMDVTLPAFYYNVAFSFNASSLGAVTGNENAATRGLDQCPTLGVQALTTTTAGICNTRYSVNIDYLQYCNFDQAIDPTSGDLIFSGTLYVTAEVEFDGTFAGQTVSQEVLSPINWKVALARTITATTQLTTINNDSCTSDTQCNAFGAVQCNPGGDKNTLRTCGYGKVGICAPYPAAAPQGEFGGEEGEEGVASSPDPDAPAYISSCVPYGDSSAGADAIVPSWAHPFADANSGQNLGTNESAIMNQCSSNVVAGSFCDCEASGFAAAAVDGSQYTAPDGSVHLCGADIEAPKWLNCGGVSNTLAHTVNWSEIISSQHDYIAMLDGGLVTGYSGNKPDVLDNSGENASLKLDVTNSNSYEPAADTGLPTIQFGFSTNKILTFDTDYAQSFGYQFTPDRMKYDESATNTGSVNGLIISPWTTGITLLAKDNVALEATCQINITVIDDVDPIYKNCPAYPTAAAPLATNQWGSWGAILATDNKDFGDLTATMLAPYTTADPTYGTHKVVYSVEDAAENKVECTFYVYFSKEAPYCNAAWYDANLVIADSEDDGYKSVSWNKPTATDFVLPANDFHAPVVVDATPFDPAGTGAELGDGSGGFVYMPANAEQWKKVATYTVTDALGNVGRCDMLALILDQKSPVCVSPQASQELEMTLDQAYLQSGANWSFLDPAASSAADFGSILGIANNAVCMFDVNGNSQDYANDHQVQAGPNAITCSYTDHGNGAGIAAGPIGFTFFGTGAAYDNQDMLTTGSKATDLSNYPSLATVCQYTITIVDKQAPKSNCPAGAPGIIEIPNTVDIITAKSAFTTPTFTDNYSPLIVTNITAVATSSDGTVLCHTGADCRWSAGLVTVSFTASDDALNINSECISVYNVVDIYPPVVTAGCPTDTTEFTALGKTTWTPAADDARFNIATGDNSGVVASQSYTAVPAADANGGYGLGVHTITFEACDAWAPTPNCDLALCVFKITVEDNEDPKISCVDAGPDPDTVDILFTTTYGGGLIYRVGVDAGGNFKTYTSGWRTANSTDNFMQPDYADPSLSYVGTTVATSAQIFETTPLGLGLHRVVYSAIDVNGNGPVTCEFQIEVVDNKDPEVFCDTWVHPVDFFNTIQSHDYHTFDLAAFALPGNDDNIGVDRFTLEYCSTAGSCVAVDDYDFSAATSTMDTAFLPYALNYTAYDKANNKATCEIVIKVKDNENPSCAYHKGYGGSQTTTVVVEMDAGEAYYSGSVTSKLDASSSSDNHDIGAASIALTSPTAAVTNHNDESSLPNLTGGSWTVDFGFTDFYTNSNSCPVTVIVIDEEKPIMPGGCSIYAAEVFSTDVDKDFYSGAWSPATLTDFTDNVEIATQTLTAIHTPPNGAALPSQTIAYGQQLDLGKWDITLSASDTALDKDGNADPNSDACTWQIIIGDDYGPSITCPADQTFNVDDYIATFSGAWVTTGLSASDNAGVVTPFLVTSQTVFEIGEHTIRYNVTDAAYIVAPAQEHMNTCTFTITVRDERAPKIDCSNGPLGDYSEPANMYADGNALYSMNVTGTTSVLIDWYENPTSIVDNVLAADVGYNGLDSTHSVERVLPTPQGAQADFKGDLAAGATYKVTFVADDNQHYSPDDVCVYYIKVVDSAGPSVDCAKFNLLPSGQFDSFRRDEITKPYYIGDFYPIPMGAATDNVGIARSTVKTESSNAMIDADGAFFLSEPGGEIYNITFTVWDAEDNMATCSFEIDVYDTESPTSTTPDGTVLDAVFADYNTSTYSGGWLSPSMSDNVQVASIALLVTNTAAGQNNVIITQDSILQQGVNLITYVVKDTSNNKHVFTISLTVGDNTPPTLTCGISPLTIYLPDADTYDVTAAHYSLHNPSTVSLNDYGTPIVLTAYDNTDPTAILTEQTDLANAEQLPMGSKTFRFTHMDANKNPALECVVVVNVVDQTQPVVDTTKPLFVVGAKECTTSDKRTMAWGVRIFDNGIHEISYETVPADAGTPQTVVSGASVFAIGQHNIKVKVNDGSTGEVTEVFTLTVEDCGRPQPGCPSNFGVAFDSGYDLSPKLQDVTHSLVSLTDNNPDFVCCQYGGQNTAGPHITVTNPDFAGASFASHDLPLGLNTITYIVDDRRSPYAQGLDNSCSFQIDVYDNENPVGSCNGYGYTHTDAMGDYPTWAPVTWTDNYWFASELTAVGQISGPTSTTKFDQLGPVTVVYSATDGSDNTGTCSFIVNRKDTTPPVIDCGLVGYEPNATGTYELTTLDGASPAAFDEFAKSIQVRVNATDNWSEATIQRKSQLMSRTGVDDVLVNGMKEAPSCTWTVQLPGYKANGDPVFANQISRVITAGRTLCVVGDGHYRGSIQVRPGGNLVVCGNGVIVGSVMVENGATYWKSPTTGFVGSLNNLGSTVIKESNCETRSSFGGSDSGADILPTLNPYTTTVDLKGRTTYVWTFTATDEAGNKSDECVITAVIKDVEPPRADSCPEDVTIRNTAQNAPTVINLSFPHSSQSATSYTDNLDPTVTDITYVASGGDMTFESTNLSGEQVFIKAVDVSGNYIAVDGNNFPAGGAADSTHYCTFLVTIYKTYDPVPLLVPAFLAQVFIRDTSPIGQPVGTSYGAYVEVTTGLPWPHRFNSAFTVTGPALDPAVSTNAWVLTVPATDNAVTHACPAPLLSGTTNIDPNGSANCVQTFAFTVNFPLGCAVSDAKYTLAATTHCSAVTDCQYAPSNKSIEITLGADNYCNRNLADVVVTGTVKAFAPDLLATWETAVAADPSIPSPAHQETWLVNAANNSPMGILAELESTAVDIAAVDTVNMQMAFYTTAARTDLQTGVGSNPIVAVTNGAPVDASTTERQTGTNWASLTMTPPGVPAEATRHATISVTLAVSYRLGGRGDTSLTRRRRLLQAGNSASAARVMRKRVQLEQAGAGAAAARALLQDADASQDDKIVEAPFRAINHVLTVDAAQRGSDGLFSYSMVRMVNVGAASEMDVAARVRTHFAKTFNGDFDVEFVRTDGDGTMIMAITHMANMSDKVKQSVASSNSRLHNLFQETPQLSQIDSDWFFGGKVNEDAVTMRADSGSSDAAPIALIAGAAAGVACCVLLALLFVRRRRSTKEAKHIDDAMSNTSRTSRRSSVSIASNHSSRRNSVNPAVPLNFDGVQISVSPNDLVGTKAAPSKYEGVAKAAPSAPSAPSAWADSSSSDDEN
jgi:hypothetical protein